MTRQDHNQVKPTCQLCPRTDHLRRAALVSPAITEEIRTAHPDWSESGFICRDDLAAFRAARVRRLLEQERGELSDLDREVIESLRQHEIVAANVESEFDEQATLGGRIADKVASFGGSWKFILSFGAIIAVWMIINTVFLVVGRFDPYPFILLNLVLSCLAALQAPVIMMSQNRQETKDRRRAESEYRVNLKAELEIRHLHEKIDHLLSHQWERMVEVQQVQLDLLDELSGSRPARRARAESDSGRDAASGPQEAE